MSGVIESLSIVATPPATVNEPKSSAVRSATPTVEVDSTPEPLVVRKPPLFRPAKVIVPSASRLEEPMSMLPKPEVIEPALRAPTVVTLASVVRLGRVVVAARRASKRASVQYRLVEPSVRPSVFPMRSATAMFRVEVEVVAQNDPLYEIRSPLETLIVLTSARSPRL